MDKVTEDFIRHLNKDESIFDFLYKLEKSVDDEKRMLLIMSMNKKYNIKVASQKVQEKSAEVSRKFREEGNQLFKKAQYVRACEKYTRSIAFAPKQSAELSLAYANQSAALFRLKKYEQCLLAMDSCLNADYPEELRTKVLMRKAECLTMFRHSGAERFFEETRKWIETRVSDCKQKSELIDKLLEFIKKNTQDLMPTVVKTDLKTVFRHFYYNAVSKEVPFASDALAIEYNPTFGRHIVATRDIKPGEILAKESPYYMVLKFTDRYLYCGRCLESILHCVPCDDCVYVVYCSDECKQIAWKSFHSLECAIMPHLLGLQNEEVVHNFQASLRPAIMGVNELGSIAKLMEEVKQIAKCKDSRTKGFSSDGKFYSNKYRSFCSLCNLIDFKSHKLSLSHLTYPSMIVYILASETNFFGKKMDNWEDLCNNHEAVFIGALLFRHWGASHINAYVARESTDVNDRKRGSAVFPFFSFLNHSCVPNVVRSCRKEYNFLYAIHPIHKGEQLYISYISNCYTTPKIERQNYLLNTYVLKCECIACRENWPTLNRYPSFKEMIHDKQMIKKLNDNMLQIEDYIIKPISEHIGNLENAPIILEELSKALKFIAENVPSPCIEVQHIMMRIILLFENSRYTNK